MTPISSEPGADSDPGRDARGPDLAARLKGCVRQLRARAERWDTLIEAVREASASLEPARVAEALVRQAHSWVPAPCWAVVAHDSAGELKVFAERGLTPALDPALLASAGWVMRHGVELFAADLARDSRGAPGATGTAVAFPLVCRGRTMGAVVGLDAAPSSAAPSLTPSLALALRAALEPGAIALDNALALQKAEALSVTDDLTRLYNSRYLDQVLRRETKRSARSGRPLSLLFLDLDGFKQVNDSHGHLTGSKALVEVGALIRACARETDVVARFGGDEFSLVLPDTGSQGAHAVAVRVRDRLRAARLLATEGLAVRITASIGVATLPDVAESAETLMRAADTAMYKVKAAGKDGVHIARAQEEDERR